MSAFFIVLLKHSSETSAIKGASINLRNFSNSDTESKARWTIDINIKQIPEENKIFNRKSIELKFQ
ncbi:hypothetical protein DB278_04145 [Pasteurella multocida]|nr:hypothetical protein DB278_04145 [Pasteurella multocida]